MSVNPQYLTIEIIVYIIAGFALRHAKRLGWHRLAELLSAMLYGLLLEALTMWQAQNYRYGRFAVMIRDIPLSIGIGWGLIIYSAMVTSDYLQLPTPVRPLLDTLLAVHIDLNMDPVANRIGMWDYAPGGPWFDVPYGNYFGWLTAVFFFSAWMRYLRGKVARQAASNRYLAVGYPVIALPLALVSLGISNQLLLLYLAHGYPDGLLVWTLIGLSVLAVMFWGRGSKQDNRPDPLVLLIPFVFQAYFVTLIFVNGYAHTVPYLAPVAILIWGIGLAAYSAPYWRYFAHSF